VSVDHLPLTVWQGQWAVCRLGPDAPVPGWALTPGRLRVVARTAAELSLVVPSHDVPADAQAEHGFRVIAVEGSLPFHVVGLIAALASALADAGVSLFPIATYDTDYLLVKEDVVTKAVDALRRRGWRVTVEPDQT
jgi:hypothetical protein